MSAVYNEIQFDTELEAIWAAFFDIAGWKWWKSPLAVANWKPDFKVTFPCGHSECGGSHTLLISVLPIRDLDNISGHPALNYEFGVPSTSADGGALFGSRPFATKWVIAHGSGGGTEDVYSRINNADEIWAKAVSLVANKC